MNNGFPSQMISGPASHSPWMTTEHLQKNGTLVMWQEGSDVELPLLDELTTVLPNSTAKGMAKYQGQWQIDWRDSNAQRPLVINWVAYVPEHCQKSSK